MISIDTNILVRICHEDPESPGQTKAARRLALDKANSEGIFVAFPTLIETIWVLVSRYKVDKQNVIQFVYSLLSTNGVKVDQELLILAALKDWERGSAGFVDYLILGQAEQNGCTTTYTFEKRKMAKDHRATTLEY